MLVPSIFGDRFFDERFDLAPFGGFYRTDNRAHVRRPAELMKTDIRENENGYELSIELPGFSKDDISVELSGGYLTVNAKKESGNDETNDRGELIRRERFLGSMKRSYYVGSNVKEDDIRAKFDQCILTLSVPKPGTQLPEKKTILIED